jgi:uncharacterized protein (DUF1501 family)
MNRRSFLRTAGGFVAANPLAAAVTALPFAGASIAFAAAPAGADYRRLLVLVELKGGNDGLNTVVPYRDANYYALRPKIAIAPDTALPLSDRAALHPSLAPLMPLWQSKELAILQGVGYPTPNLSHFRSIEIWDTASRSDQYLPEGWLTRVFARAPAPQAFAADGVVIGSNDMGPLAGGGTRAIALANTTQFLNRAKLAHMEGAGGNRALAHILKTEADIVQAASHLDASHEFTTEFPAGGFGGVVKTAAQVVANPGGVAVLRLTLGGFDTHSGQPGTQARLLSELAGGLVALKAALTELSRWDDTLIVTYAEFGRRPKENLSNGTDHGTASVHFALGGRVKGGLYGEAPDLAKLSGDGNPAFAIDFRSVYATVLDRWWGVDSKDVLGGRYTSVPLLRA